MEMEKSLEERVKHIEDRHRTIIFIVASSIWIFITIGWFILDMYFHVVFNDANKEILTNLFLLIGIVTFVLGLFSILILGMIKLMDYWAKP